ncbi:hypothetical protein AVEN_48238-1 [Araneus ventricosus]|uniref:Reverse transcriptase domain-containing protein n=1 Tax=Araneus ventricosus TaxID=182803 RepID=A0A4Y2WR46_ARAVE|nr:hypothetical protein AVEN_48238-1 [Araneus ventricosus]
MSKSIKSFPQLITSKQEHLRAVPLAPILFNIFNSDFHRKDKVPNCLFADDSAILTQGSNIRFLIKTLPAQLDSTEYWCTKWRVASNTDKTKAILFRKGHSSKVLKTLSFMEEDLPWENQVKYLGLILDSKFFQATC